MGGAAFGGTSEGGAAPLPRWGLPPGYFWTDEGADVRT